MDKQYPGSAWRRAMKEQEVILRAISGELKWLQAADICGLSPRQMRRKHHAFKEFGVDGLLDRRRGRPSSRRIPYDVVEQVLRLYREDYFDFNVKHFHEHLVRDHGVAISYSSTRNILQECGLVKRGKGRGGHRKRRERRPVFGQMLHLDGSDHEWLLLCPGERQVLLLVVDDATGNNLCGRLVEAETTIDCLSVMREVVEVYGIPAQLYTDRHSVYWHTKKAGGRVDRDRLTQFGRAMEELGVEMIPGYSPQARGRSERWNGTWQDRLVSELRKEGIRDMETANRYINEVFIPDMNARFSVEPASPGSAFVSADGADLDKIFSVRHHGRAVANDNTVRVNGLALQIEKSRYRHNFCQCKVEVFEHLDGSYSVCWKKRLIGRYDAFGKAFGAEPDNEEDMGLSHCGPGKSGTDKPGKKKERRKSKTPASSPVDPRALGSLPSVALSSRGTRR